MKIKVCGMKYRDNMMEVAQLAPDMLGFIFYPKSSRYMAETLVPDDLKELDQKIQKVGVFVNQPIEYVLEQADRYQLDAIQFHGSETPEDLSMAKKMGKKTIKALPPSAASNLELLSDYSPVTDCFLFDTPSPSHGGTGQTFNWSELKELESTKPFFLSGGLSLENWKDVIGLDPQPSVLDVNSRFEIEPGRKNIDLVKELITQVRHEFQN
jgi:phosphoribosylanthranilate isomerase